MSQVDLRVRGATDVVVLCSKTEQGHYLQFVNYKTKMAGRRYFLPTLMARRFWGMYNTGEVLSSLLPKPGEFVK